MTSARRVRRRLVAGLIASAVLAAMLLTVTGGVAPKRSAPPPDTAAAAATGATRLSLDRAVTRWESESADVRGPRARVIGSGAADLPSGRLVDAEHAALAASVAWPTWAPRAPLTLTVLAPASESEFAALTGLPGGDASAQVAAVTDGPLSSDGRAHADRIVLNPSAMARLTPAGRAFVLRHEAVHVALRAALSGSQPRWLSEGYADWVAYADPAVLEDVADDPAPVFPTPPSRGLGSTLDQGLTPHQVAVDALAQVRSGGPPRHLPTSAEFDDPATRAAAYQRSWVLVSLLADRYGVERLRSFIVAATVRERGSSGPAEVATVTDALPAHTADVTVEAGVEADAEAGAEAAADAAFGQVLGTSRAEITRLWSARLATLAGS